MNRDGYNVLVVCIPCRKERMGVRCSHIYDMSNLRVNALQIVTLLAFVLLFGNQDGLFKLILFARGLNNTPSVCFRLSVHFMTRVLANALFICI